MFVIEMNWLGVILCRLLIFILILILLLLCSIRSLIVFLILEFRILFRWMNWVSILLLILISILFFLIFLCEGFLGRIILVINMLVFLGNFLWIWVFYLGVRFNFWYLLNGLRMNWVWIFLWVMGFFFCRYLSVWRGWFNGRK